MRAKTTRRRRSSKETESALLKAAEVVFGDKGYVDATVDEIVDYTGISRGTFYIYFENKEDIFRKLLDLVVDDILKSARAASAGSHRDRIEFANRHYFEAMQRNRKILKALLQIANFNPEFSAVYGELRSRFITRIERDLRRKIGQGVVRPLDTRLTSYALGLMIESIAYAWLVTGYEPWSETFELEAMVKEVTDLWCAAVFVGGAEHQAPEQTPQLARLAAQTAD
ncbi:MAG: hypothetical protein BGP06_05115 [Rhizobiales bacterium 65-9]|nr:TetR/AcrR family transcriptional regulator [Hyphomicrobiales bacterium]OJY35274.1 MAG: hypothetical protein BGP06_05115 [Rhizobiales bacterium 65-9]